MRPNLFFYPQTVFCDKGLARSVARKEVYSALDFTPMLTNLVFSYSRTHSNHVTSSKQGDTLISHATMRRNPINFLYNPGHVTL